MEPQQLKELLYEALETEQGGILVYETALRCALDEDLKEEWTEYLEQTRNHERVIRDVMEQLQLDPEKDTPGRAIVHHIGQSLIRAMEMALASGDAEAAQRVSTECVVLAETKDHMNWSLMSEFAKASKGEEARILQDAVDEVEDEEDEHLYHSAGWARELWIDSLGMPAVLPPPEEEKGVRSAIGAAKAKEAREDMLKSKRPTRKAG